MYIEVLAPQNIPFAYTILQKAITRQSARDPHSEQGNMPRKSINTAHALSDKAGIWHRFIPIHMSTDRMTVKLLAYPDTEADINIIAEKLLP